MIFSENRSPLFRIML